MAAGQGGQQLADLEEPHLGALMYENSARAFEQIRRYAVMRLALFIAKRHQRGRAWGFAQIYCSGDGLGLISLNGIVIAPRPHQAWREKSNTAW